MGWRDRARLASYQDALAYLESNPESNPEAILDVRRSDKVKYGVGINIEQAVTDDTAYFLRAMQADGHTETYAFTEADGSLGTGFTFKGTRWGRNADTMGAAYMRNTLSNERRDYLEAGGISFFIGDGALHYQPEQVLETYYSFGIHKMAFLTVDYQRIWNPAYNADRGPVDVGSFRLHTEF